MSDPLPLIALIHPQSATCRHYMACSSSSSSSSSFPSPEMDEHDEVSDDQILQQQQQAHFNLNTANILVGEAYTGGQDHLLPMAIVGRIMKQALPPNAKISKQAKETVQECASEFISFITAEAAGSCERNNRKTVSGDDICSAMKTLGLDIYADTMRRYLHRYKEHHEERAAPASSTSIHRLHHGSNARVASINLVDELSVSKSKRSSSSRMRLFPTD